MSSLLNTYRFLKDFHKIRFKISHLIMLIILIPGCTHFGKINNHHLCFITILKLCDLYFILSFDLDISHAGNRLLKKEVITYQVSFKYLRKFSQNHSKSSKIVLETELIFHLFSFILHFQRKTLKWNSYFMNQSFSKCAKDDDLREGKMASAICWSLRVIICIFLFLFTREHFEWALYCTRWNLCDMPDNNCKWFTILKENINELWVNSSIWIISMLVIIYISMKYTN